MVYFFFFQAEDGIRDYKVTGVQTCALPISQPPDDGGTAQEGEHERRHDRARGAKREVVEQVEKDVLLRERREQVIEHVQSSVQVRQHPLERHPAGRLEQYDLVAPESRPEPWAQRG